MISSLRNGHLTHCGWTNNFCGEEFLNFPPTSSEILREDFLRRLRNTLLALAEFSRSSTLSIIGNQTGGSEGVNDEGIVSNSAATAVSSPILKVRIGKSLCHNFSSLSQWLLNNSLPLHASGSVIELPLRAVSYSECRSLIAATIEFTDSLLKKSSYSHLLHPQLEDENTISLLDDLLQFDTRKSNEDCRLEAVIDGVTAEDRTMRQLVKLCVLTSICGWSPTKLLTSAISAPSSSLSEGGSSYLSNHQVDVAPAAIPASATGDAFDGFKCDWCGRSFPFKYLLSTAVDPLFQHRGFCVWAHSTEVEGISDDVRQSTLHHTAPGWLQCAGAVANSLQNNPSVCALEIGVAGQESGSATTTSDGTGCSTRETSSGSAEHAYKKIKLVLDSATSPRLSLNGRLSL